ncbi:MAG TPA: hypothetical protein VJT71_03865 [Pyrinomonadaceae bacterium]|nr:hypothetical protein [Pyrinomonadaceae bacterium]
MKDEHTHTQTQHAGSETECCADEKCETALRNNYFEGKRLTPDSFRVEQTYMRDRRYLLNRAIHGWGVVYGYRVGPDKPDPKQPASGALNIGPGLALDKCGRELVEIGTPIKFEDVIFLDKDGKLRDLQEEVENLGPRLGYTGSGLPQELVDSLIKECWLLRVHYAERDTAHVRVEDSCRCGRDEWNHTCETVRYSVQRIDCKECCADFDCELTCDCGSGKCCDDEHMRLPSGVHKRGGCQCLCKHLTKLPVGGECDNLCEIKEPCGIVRVDLRNGVPLACVELVAGKCGLEFGAKVESCGPRRLVKRNDLLFDLIRGCDLTRITKIGWYDWHRQSEPIPFEAFADAFGPGDGNENYHVTKKFWVEFSRQVQRKSIRRDCFVMTVISGERDDGWWETLRVPIVRVEAEDSDLVQRARIVVDEAWFKDTIKGAASLFQGKVTRIEIEIRGDFIVDCNGQTVDANAFGLSPGPSGNGTLGGTFLSTFLVGPAPTPSRPASYYSEDRIKGVS